MKLLELKENIKNLLIEVEDGTDIAALKAEIRENIKGCC